MSNTVATLKASDNCGICVFDNLQTIKSLKFQQGGHSSDVSLVTSRLFFKARIPNLLSLLQWPEQRVPLTYSKQNIPSSPGMPVYESIADLNPKTFDGSTVCSTIMDTSGNRVEAWAQIALLSSQIYKFKCSWSWKTAISSNINLTRTCSACKDSESIQRWERIGRSTKK